MGDDLAPPSDALQQRHGPRPLPLFLELVRQVSETEPGLGRAALAGLGMYQRAERRLLKPARPVLNEHGGVSIKDCGGSGTPIVLVPSLINPPAILDLDSSSSLADALAPVGRVLLIDWGAASGRLDLDVGAHVTQRLLPLLDQLDQPPILVGYCLGGTMALAAAAIRPTIPAVVTLAAPWVFAAYQPGARDQLTALWHKAKGGSERLGVLPLEVLQAAFWSIDPARVVSKFARLAELDQDGEEFRRFVTLEDWANTGEPLPIPAARELIEDLFGEDLPGRAAWIGSGLPRCPSLHVSAADDLIVPAATVAPTGEHISSPAGHVGMIVGRSAPEKLHRPMRQWLEALQMPR
jgi:polyhydroxyalkanoate synthase subunit PhaC